MVINLPKWDFFGVPIIPLQRKQITDKIQKPSIYVEQIVLVVMCVAWRKFVR